MVSAVKRRRIRRAQISLLVLGLLAALAICAFWRGLTVSRYEVKISGLPEAFRGFRIVQVTDLHCDRFGKEQEELCAKIRSLDPDILVLTGEMNDQMRLDPEPARELCSAFADEIPMYAVLGNHDLWLANSDLKALLAVYEDCGVTVLRGDSVPITIGSDTIYLHGADDPAHWGNDTVGFVETNPPELSPVDGAVNILLYHRANAFPAISGFGFDLIISGHTHGGQVRLPFVGGLVSPTREFFPDFTAGIYRENGSQMVVGRGLGNAVSVPRIFNPPELVLITLQGSTK